jgi:hypothetical protein
VTAGVLAVPLVVNLAGRMMAEKNDVAEEIV